MLDICRCCPILETCCKMFPLFYSTSKRMVYKNNPWLKKYPFIHREGKWFVCDNYDDETRLCKDYENRPFFCQNFVCSMAIEILDLVQEPMVNKVS